MQMTSPGAINSFVSDSRQLQPTEDTEHSIPGKMAGQRLLSSQP